VGFDGTVIVWKTEYNARGEVARRSNPAFLGDPLYWTSYTYDPTGRILTEAAPRNQGGGVRTTSFAYSGLSTTQTDPRGNRTTRTVDATGRIQRVTDALSNVTTYRYDAFDNLIATIDPKGNQIISQFDLRGRKLSTRDPDLGTWTYGYNGFGDLLWQRDAKGQVQTLTYDVLGRTRTRTEMEGVTTWTWDGSVKGVLSSVTSPGGYVRVHTYDNRARPYQTTETIGGVSFTFARHYDAQGRLWVLQYPGGMAVRYAYNARGYLYSILDNSQKPCWTGVSQDALGNWTLYRSGNSVETLRSHDLANGWIQTVLSGHTTASSANVQ
jgi:YD repeat-containing protein